MTPEFRALIGKVATGATLGRDEATSAFEQMMSGEATPSQMGALLMALRVRGETVDEITGAVSFVSPHIVAANTTSKPIDRAVGELGPVHLCGVQGGDLSVLEVASD